MRLESVVKIGSYADYALSVFAKSKSKGRASARGRKSNGNAQGPSRDMLDTWRRGDYDLEPSTKMLALIGLLKEAENAGDKTIVYSQCRSTFRCLHSTILIINRDYDA